VGANAIRDGLFLSSYRVETLPYLMAGAALLALPAAQLSGHVLSKHGPVRMVPAVFSASAALFLAEWMLVGWQPRVAAVVLYLHSSVLGAIAISLFWSLLNERFDPHTAKPLLARVAASATLGGVCGGVLAERVTALFSQAALLLVLAALGGLCVGGAVAIGGDSSRRPAAPETEGGGWRQIGRQPLLRGLALVVVLAAALAALTDYMLKSEAVAHFGKGPALVGFFGLFYSATGLAAALVQSLLGRWALLQFGLAGSVASHALVVGAASVVGLALPAPWRGLAPRSLDVTTRNSLFRAGYELLYTPLAQTTKRAAKSLIDVACDCAGKSAGAGLILSLVALAPAHPLVAVNLAAIALAGAEYVVARRLRAGYVGALEGGLRRQDDDALTPAAQYSVADFTVVGNMTGLDMAAVRRALAEPEATDNPPADPVVAALRELRSHDLARIRAALLGLPRDPVLVGALVPLLARSELVRPVMGALALFGARAAGELVSALLDPETPEVVRRRLPLALKSCPSLLARDGLVAGLEAQSFEVRSRCARALLALTDEHPELGAPLPTLPVVERELRAAGEPQLVRDHVFNLLALALEREPVRIAARSFGTDDAYVRGTALEYLETVLPAPLFAALRPLLSIPVATAAPAARRGQAQLRDELIRAGSTMTLNLDEVRRQLEAAAADES
jgi:hypothetical protein